MTAEARFDRTYYYFYSQVMDSVQKWQELIEITDDDVINYLDSYFETFEEKLRKDEVNLQVPITIISKFKRLVELWNENLMISRSLNSNLFAEVYDRMSKSFNNRSKTSICSDESHLKSKRRCNEEITVRNNDRKNLETNEYVEFVRNINSLESFDRMNIILGDNEKFPILESFEKFVDRCNICNVSIPNPCLEQNSDVPTTNKSDVHIQSHNHLYNLYLFHLNKDYLECQNPRRKLFRCKLCNLVFRMNTLSYHYRSTHHAEKYNTAMKSRSKIFKLKNHDINGSPGKLAMAISNFRDTLSASETMVTRTDVDFISISSDEVRCSICDSKLSSMASALTHIRGSYHKRRINSLTSNVRYLRIDWLSHTQARLCCFPCGTTFESMNHLLNHVEERNHLEKITHWQALPNQAVGKFNETLIDLSKFEFNCFTCNISCIGFDNLISHYQRDHAVIK